MQKKQDVSKKTTFSNFRIGFLLKKLSKSEKEKKTSSVFCRKTRQLTSSLRIANEKNVFRELFAPCSLNGKPLKKQNLFFFVYCKLCNRKETFPRRQPTKI